MADYYQVKNQNIFTPPANISLGNTSNQYSNVYVQNNLVVGNVTVTSSTIIAPRVTTITYPGNDTAADPAGGQTITLTGSGFVVSASILINSIAVSVVSVVSSTEITFTSPANSSGSYVIYVVNPDGSTAIAVPGIQYSGIPTWTTAAGTLGSLYETANFSQTVTATGDAPITYSVASGTLPPGATFNGNGTITGTSQLTASPTTYTFTVSATDAEQQDTNRSFSLTINTDVVTWTTPAANSTTTLSQNVASTTTLLATSAAGKAITYTANALPTGLSIVGAAVTGTPTVIGNTASLFTATAATTGRTTTATINWTISVASDTYFPYTTLLLSGQTSTSTFIADASTNNFALTIAGDTKPNNFNPYTPGYYSNYFDGTGDYLSIANNAALNLGNNSWTCELWIYPTGNYTTYNTLFAKRNSASLCAYEGYLTPTNGYLGYYNGTLYTSATAPNTGKWNHIAYVFDGTNIKIYLNGTQVLSSATSNADQAVDLYIGMYNSSGTPYDYYFGYISNFRLVKGVAVYTGTFTPPTAPLTATQSSGTNISAITGTQTSLLTCQSNRFIDNSTNAFTITVVGNTTINPANPFVPDTQYAAYGSTYFDGTGDYLTAPSNAAFAMGTGDFTIEFWYYKTLQPSTTDGLVSMNYLTGFHIAENTTGIFVWVAGTQVITETTPILLNAWSHVAVSRSGSSLKVFLNGVQINSGTSSGSVVASTLQIGASTHNLSEATNGYMTDVRILKGTALYTTAFTPPAAPLTAIANTSLLTCQTNQPVNNNVFLDNSTNNFFVTRNGNTTQGTFSPYGANWSNYFDGTGDNLLLPFSSAFNLPADFTIECWIFPTVASGMIINCGGGSNIAWASYELVWYGSAVNFAGSSVNNGYDIGSETGGTGTIGTPTLNQWSHIAITRSGNVYRGFLNGVQGYTQTLALTPYNQTTRGLAIGSNYDNTWGSGTPASPVTGYISNARIVKGTAVYTANFTPSTTPLTAIANTSLLTCQSNRFIDNSANAFTITITGDTKVQRFSPFSPGASYSASTTGGSAYFDGTGDYLTTNYTINWSTYGSYTLEFWVYHTAMSTNQLYFAGGTSGTGNTIFYTYADGRVGVGINGTNEIASSSGVIKANTWQHIAYTFNGTTTIVYVDGVQVVSGTTAIYANSSVTLAVGGGSASSSILMNGYISNMRFSKSVIYSSAFTPPTSPVTAITNTSLLLNMTGAGIYDSTSINNLETVGDAKISTAQSKFGGGSMSFDGTGDSLNIFNNTVGVLGTANFTVEAWIYTTVSSGTQCVYDTRQNDATTTGFYFGLYSTNILLFYTSGALTITGGTVAANTWTHIALVRVGNTFTGYINGTSVGTATSSNNFTNTIVQIGSSNNVVSSSLNYYNGYIDDLRVTKGVARYTANFAPPTAAFPTY